MKKNVLKHHEVAAAIQKFLKDGGLIEKLPEQNVRRQDIIGDEKYEMYEKVSRLPILH